MKYSKHFNSNLKLSSYTDENENCRAYFQSQSSPF